VKGAKLNCRFTLKALLPAPLRLSARFLVGAAEAIEYFYTLIAPSVCLLPDLRIGLYFKQRNQPGWLLR
jgi:hypothetical protein